MNYFYKQYDQWLNDIEKNISNDFHLFGALINLVNEKHNFIWEREWRTVGDYGFITPDIIGVIAPENEHKIIRKEINHFADSISIIDIEWSLETLLTKLSAFGWNNQYKYEQVFRELEIYKNEFPDFNIDDIELE